MPATPPKSRRSWVSGGVVFNPWVNIPVCIVIALGCGAVTYWMSTMLGAAWEAPPYEDQNLDILGGLIGVVVMGLVTLTMVGVTIFTIRWWARVIAKDKANAKEANAEGQTVTEDEAEPRRRGPDAPLNDQWLP